MSSNQELLDSLINEDDYCYPLTLFDDHPDSDSDYNDYDQKDPLTNIFVCKNSCDDCKNGCNECVIGRCYCPNSIHYVILDYVYEGHDEVKFSKFDQSLQEHKRGLYHLSVLPPHGTTHNITIINNNNEYDSEFDDDNII